MQRSEPMWSERERAIQSLKSVKVETKGGRLTLLSIVMILVDLERRGIKFDKFSPAPTEEVGGRD
jgi:hypothetical protein